MQCTGVIVVAQWDPVLGCFVIPVEIGLQSIAHGYSGGCMGFERQGWSERALWVMTGLLAYQAAKLLNAEGVLVGIMVVVLIAAAVKGYIDRRRDGLKAKGIHRTSGPWVPLLVCLALTALIIGLRVGTTWSFWRWGLIALSTLFAAFAFFLVLRSLRSAPETPSIQS